VLRSDASYVVAGALGGLGRSISRWLVERGARNLILLSRSTFRANAEASRLLKDFVEAGVKVECVSCDVADLSVLEKIINNCKITMPPVAGCIQAAMVLHVSCDSASKNII